MTRAEIEQQAEQFFEWSSGDNHSVVTYTSALLFAEHCVREVVKAESDLLAIAYVDGRRQGRIDRLGGK